ncbi:MAG: DUF3488 and transglutaminase-like domain-containing protein [Methylobacillus sp.]|jgi:transglutaminase-like putative cysteine protease|nr:DUF3488 and transglutaminase-like domain-containing protein [Methylobacillus sp.]
MKKIKPAPRLLTLNDVRWLLVALALVMAPLFFYIANWVLGCAVLAGIWRYWIAAKERPPLRAYILVPLALAGAYALLASNGYAFGRDASVALLTLLLAMKFLESRTRRDGILLISLCWFLLVTIFLFTQTLPTAFYFALPIFALVIALIGINHPNGALPFKFRLRLAGNLLLQTLPVLLVLFFLFPRLAGPLWRTPGDATRAMTGLSDTMSPGSISELIASDLPAFRAEFSGKLPAADQLYWRGPVMWNFDGRTWRAGSHAYQLSPEPLEVPANLVNYAVTLEPHNRPWLFALDVPMAAPPESILRNDHQLIVRRLVTTRMRYEVQSALSYRIQPQLDDATREAATQIPKIGNERAIELAQSWVDQGLDDQAIARKALEMFRTQNFVYTLYPTTLGIDPVDEFLFDSKRGFCEHYAGSFVFLMRAAGIPARIVTGYLGGIVNPIGNYMIVRQSDAHAWAEIWLRDKGWTRIDPTAAVSPARIESGLSQLPAGEPVPMLARGGDGWLTQLYLGWDAINNRWNQWVLGYNQAQQMQLLQGLLGSHLTMRNLATATIIGILALLAGLSWSLLRDRAPRPDKLAMLWQRFRRKLAKRGIHAPPFEGPLDFGQRAARALPQQADIITRIAQTYARLRYGKTQDDERQLEKEIREFKP